MTNLSELPISLEYLNCDNNQLTNISTIHLTQLKELFCNNNQLQRLPDLSYDLEYLECGGNKNMYIPNFDSLSETVKDFINEGIQLDCSNLDQIKMAQHNEKRSTLGFETIDILPDRETWDHINTLYEYRPGGEICLRCEKVVNSL